MRDRQWTHSKNIAHVRLAHRCLDCGTLIAVGACAVSVCGRGPAGGWWYGYQHDRCHFDNLHEAWMDTATEMHLTGGDIGGRAAAWEDMLTHLERHGEAL